jgi:hypothetical protein
VALRVVSKLLGGCKNNVKLPMAVFWLSAAFKKAVGSFISYCKWDGSLLLKELQA